MDAKKIGKFIYQIRTEKRMTQKELAEQINVTDKAVSKWENGEGCPDVSLLPVLSKVLNVEILDLLEGNLPLENTSKKIYFYDFGATNLQNSKLKTFDFLIRHLLLQNHKNRFFC